MPSWWVDLMLFVGGLALGGFAGLAIGLSWVCDSWRARLARSEAREQAAVTRADRLEAELQQVQAANGRRSTRTMWGD